MLYFFCLFYLRYVFKPNKEFNSTCLVSFPSVRAAGVCVFPHLRRCLELRANTSKVTQKRKVTNGCVLEEEKYEI